MTWWQRIIAWSVGLLGSLGLGVLALKKAKREQLRAGELAGQAEERARQIEQARKRQGELTHEDQVIDAQIESEIQVIDLETKAKLELGERLRAEEAAKREKP